MNNMSKNKIDSLKGLGIDCQYDSWSDMYYLRRTLPAVHQQLRIPAREMEFRDPNQLYNMFDRHQKEEEDFINLGPTNKELRDPRIRNAWEELQIMRKLIGYGS